MMPTTEELSITLPGDMAETIRGKVQAGAYASTSEKIREELHLLGEQDDLKAQRLAWMREQIDRSLADPRPSIETDDVFAQLRDRHRRRTDRDA